MIPCTPTCDPRGPRFDGHNAIEIYHKLLADIESLRTLSESQSHHQGFVPDEVVRSMYARNFDVRQPPMGTGEGVQNYNTCNVQHDNVYTDKTGQSYMSPYAKRIETAFKQFKQ